MSSITDAKIKTENELTTFPLMIDDMLFDKGMETRIVNMFTGCGASDSTKVRAYSIKSGLMLTSNYSVNQLER